MRRTFLNCLTEFESDGLFQTFLQTIPTNGFFVAGMMRNIMATMRTEGKKLILLACRLE